jgi:hypothetical protein
VRFVATASRSYYLATSLFLSKPLQYRRQFRWNNASAKDVVSYQPSRPKLNVVVDGERIAPPRSERVPQLKYDPSKASIIHQPPCSRCGADMLIARIDPVTPDTDRRTFECTKCDNEVVLEVMFDQKRPTN